MEIATNSTKLFPCSYTECLPSLSLSLFLYLSFLFLPLQKMTHDTKEYATDALQYMANNAVETTPPWMEAKPRMRQRQSETRSERSTIRESGALSGEGCWGFPLLEKLVFICWLVYGFLVFVFLGSWFLGIEVYRFLGLEVPRFSTLFVFVVSFRSLLASWF